MYICCCCVQEIVIRNCNLLFTAFIMKYCNSHRIPVAQRHYAYSEFFNLFHLNCISFTFHIAAAACGCCCCCCCTRSCLRCLDSHIDWEFIIVFYLHLHRLTIVDSRHRFNHIGHHAQRFKVYIVITRLSRCIYYHSFITISCQWISMQQILMRNAKLNHFNYN